MDEISGILYLLFGSDTIRSPGLVSITRNSPNCHKAIPFDPPFAVMTTLSVLAILAILAVSAVLAVLAVLAILAEVAVVALFTALVLLAVSGVLTV